MANIIEFTEEQKAQYDQWLAERPPVIQAMIATHPPMKLYKLAGGNLRVTIYSYAEDGTVRVLVEGKYNAVMFDRKVFGVKLDDLVECDLPAENELVGTVLTKPSEVQHYVDTIRPLVLTVEQKARLVKELDKRSNIGLMRAKMVLIAHDWNIETAIAALLKESQLRDSW